MKLNQLMHLG